jgi:hypothetical protein
MSTQKWDFAHLLKLLRHSENDSQVRNVLGQAISNIERDEYYGSLEFKTEGVEVVFREAPWVLSPAEITDPRELYVSGFHFHREAHDGYSGYAGQLPQGVAWDDAEAAIVRKMGPPSATSGRGMSTGLKQPMPRWLRYSLGDTNLQFRFDAEDRLEMLTLFAPDPRRKAG